jgi:hypothetical protein
MWDQANLTTPIVSAILRQVCAFYGPMNCFRWARPWKEPRIASQVRGGMLGQEFRGQNYKA